MVETVFYSFLIGMAVITLCCMIAYEIMRMVWNWLPRMTMPPHLRVLILIGPVFLTHILGIWIYAGTYFLLENFTTLGTVTGNGHDVGITTESFMDCLYFSTVIYTSLGFGDLIPTGGLRLIAGAEVLNGLVLIAWTASFTYLAMEKFWQTPHAPHTRRKSDIK